MLALPLQSCLVPVRGTGCVHLPLLGLLDSSCLPPEKVEEEKMVPRQIRYKTVPLFSNSRNLPCLSMANWISVSTWEHLDHTSLGKLPFLLDYILKVHNIAAVLTLLTCRRRLPCLVPIWLQVYSWLRTFLLLWDLNGTFIAAVSFLGRSLRLCPLVCFCILKWMWPFWWPPQELGRMTDVQEFKADFLLQG